ncbi:hypothetical protein PN466_05135 [Roseofilum reptotaenium CS-1145]|uniref:Uncharacterized protein n=1 Tax=Roseofilum reptotaenium AO1-A TaxID=1925591 RepID=A0A1L9QUU2_9CYAN|nr:hypothetical protein [Roseofilum reptotaenium]MDB9516341.1 hypothetical protein [Roseofilum reptotaenium CS-1145]OJJ26451.1 hypothetical protein BI308_06250 [Roseofilum reptotaenium AO1-A]
MVYDLDRVLDPGKSNGRSGMGVMGGSQSKTVGRLGKGLTMLFPLPITDCLSAARVMLANRKVLYYLVS